MRFRVFRCRKCGLYLYMRDDQKTRKCPNCNYTNSIQKIYTLKTLDSVQEATLYVQYLKLPEGKRGDFENMKNQLTQRTTAKKLSKMEIMGDIFSSLGKKFNDKIPLNALYLACENQGFEREKIDDVLGKMYNEGLVMKSKNEYEEVIIKFVGKPFVFGKMVVK